MDISGASAVVTGGASGLGAATARLLAERGAQVVVLDRSEELGAKVAAEIGGVYVAAEVADERRSPRQCAPPPSVVRCGCWSTALASAGRPAPWTATASPSTTASSSS